MRTVTDTGTYTRKGTGEEISYTFEYSVLESAKDMSEAELLALANRMTKVDANNTAREKARRENGDSTARILTPEEKAQNKAKAKVDRELLRILREQGITSPDSLKEVVG